MTTLIILGNTNQFTFANSIVVANSKSKELFKQALSNVFVFHSKESYSLLKGKEDWVDYIERNGISRRLLIERIVNLATDEVSIKEFVDHTEFVVKGNSDTSQIIVDLTNGTSSQKNLLSIACYILDLEHQYIIDTIKLFELTEERGFLCIDVLLRSYKLVPDNTLLDSIAYLNLSEMVRHKKNIESHANKYENINKDTSDKNFFKGNLNHSVKLKLHGDQNKDNAAYRIAVASISTNLEEIVRLIVNNHDLNPENSKKLLTLGDNLKIIENRIRKIDPKKFDMAFLQKFNAFALHLRNSSTHPGESLQILEKFKATLAIQMTFPFIEFYADIIHPILLEGSEVGEIDLVEEPKKMRRLSEKDTNFSDCFYYGLDGDDTGKELENLFISCCDEDTFRNTSKKIADAIKEIGEFIRNKSSKKAVVFEAGDNLLFKGSFDEKLLIEIQDKYSKKTSGLTCSIGYGKSFQEVYLALKLAKAQPGKKSIIGIEIC